MGGDDISENPKCCLGRVLKHKRLMNGKQEVEVSKARDYVSSLKAIHSNLIIRSRCLVIYSKVWLTGDEKLRRFKVGCRIVLKR